MFTVGYVVQQRRALLWEQEAREAQWLSEGRTWANRRNITVPVLATSIALSPDGKKLAAGSESEVTLWNLHSGQLLLKMKKQYNHPRVVFSADGKLLFSVATYQHFHTVKVWDAAIGKLEKTYTTYALPDYLLPLNKAAAKKVNPLGGEVRIHYRDNSKPDRTVNANVTNTQYIGALALSPNNKTLAVVGVDENSSDPPVTELQVLDMKSSRLIRNLSQDNFSIESVAFSPDSRDLAVIALAGPGDYPKRVRIWNAQSGKMVHEVPLYRGEVWRGLTFSANGKWLIGLGNTTELWRMD